MYEGAQVSLFSIVRPGINQYVMIRGIINISAEILDIIFKINYNSKSEVLCCRV